MKALAFSFIPVENLVPKPRTRSLTVMTDLGLPVQYQTDLLYMGGAYIDFAKLAIGIARLLEEEYLRQKIRAYREHDVHVFSGGILLEYAHVQGKVAEYLEECQKLGFSALEISENYVRFSPGERRDLVARARDHGFRVLAEVGRKEEYTDREALERERDIHAYLKAGADFVLVEAAEFLDIPHPEHLVRTLKEHVPVEKVIFEMPGRWLPGTRYDTTIRLMALLVRLVGPQVNLANVAPEDVLGLQAQRVRIGTTFRTPRSEAG